MNQNRARTTDKSNATSFAPTLHGDVTGGTSNDTLGAPVQPRPVRPNFAQIHQMRGSKVRAPTDVAPVPAPPRIVSPPLVDLPMAPAPEGRLAHDVSNLTLSPTRHALAQIMDKGIKGEAVMQAFQNPERVYPSGSHPDQTRVTGAGVCLVGKIEGDRFTLITVYEDGVLTAPRADQLNTPEGRRYAERYAAGLGRG